MKKKIFVAGHRGMVGRSLCRLLAKNKANNLLTETRPSLDLTNQSAVNEFFKHNRVDEVYLAAAVVGGIHANNTYPADFIYKNIMIEANVIHACFEAGVKKLLFLGSSCIYPRDADQPMSEPALLSSYLEPTNEPYAIAKIAGIKLCESYNRQYGTDFRSVMPTNLYGPWDNFHSKNSHVVPALLKRFNQARLENLKEVVCWGTGKARREFLYVEDMASASIHVMGLDKEHYQAITDPQTSHINVGFGKDITIGELALIIAEITGFYGQIKWDCSKPDGAPIKLMCSKKLNDTGWCPSTSLRDGLGYTLDWFKNNYEENDRNM